MADIRDRAIELYSPPFRHERGYIYDAEGNTVGDDATGRQSGALRVRGWGRIANMPEAEKLQDTAGELIAEILTKNWPGHAPNPVEAIEAELIAAKASPDPRAIDTLIEALDCSLREHGFSVAHHQYIDLQGMAGELLAPREIVRDKDGYLTHPALPICDEDVRADKFLAAFGLESFFRHMDGDISPEEYDRFYDEGSGCAGWNPTPPDGDGWVLLEIYDTENGPYAMFARKERQQ